MSVFDLRSAELAPAAADPHGDLWNRAAGAAAGESWRVATFDGAIVGRREDLREACALAAMYVTGDRRSRLEEAKFTAWQAVTGGLVSTNFRRKLRRPCRVICEQGRYERLEFHCIPQMRGRGRKATVTAKFTRPDGRELR